jgi:Ser/Thr protein kinase RdoA (MazF antagonist)
MLPSILPAYGLQDDEIKLESFGSGLINKTWKVIAPDKEYILQKVNHDIFKEPDHIAHNHRLIASYLKQHFPGYSFVAPITSQAGDELIYKKEEGYYRLFPFVTGSHSKDVVETPEQAYEAACQFGRFTRLLSGMDVRSLKVTIPYFHDLELRYRQFLSALETGNKDRIQQSQKLIGAVFANVDIVKQFQSIKSDPAFKLRVIHHDTKISNVLFNSNNKGICVIDLDTVMPGYFISDIGDMMRTYLSPVNEEETDFAKIQVREEFYQALVDGYCSEMKEELTEKEKESFLFAGKFMIYMQALRFLTDHLNNDIYYGAKYEGHNLARATNQLVLLQQLINKQEILADCITL